MYLLKLFNAYLSHSFVFFFLNVQGFCNGIPSDNCCSSYRTIDNLFKNIILFNILMHVEIITKKFHVKMTDKMTDEKLRRFKRKQSRISCHRHLLNNILLYSDWTFVTFIIWIHHSKFMVIGNNLTLN